MLSGFQSLVVDQLNLSLTYMACKLFNVTSMTRLLLATSITGDTAYITSKKLFDYLI